MLSRAGRLLLFIAENDDGCNDLDDNHTKSVLRDLIREICAKKLSAAEIAALTAVIGGNENGK